VSIGVLHRPGCSGEEADGRVTGTWAQASPGASEAIHSWKTGRNFFNTWLVAKRRRVKLNSKFSRSNSSKKKPRVQGSRIPLVSENTDFAETYYYL
jgi:hypothetical protein